MSESEQAPSRDAVLAFETRCVEFVRAKLLTEAHLDVSGRVITEVSLLGWYPDTRLVVRSQQGGVDGSMDWFLWRDEFPMQELLPPTYEPTERDAHLVASMVLTALEEPNWR